MYALGSIIAVEMILTLVRDILCGKWTSDTSVYDALQLSFGELRTVLLFHEYPEGNTLKKDVNSGIVGTIDETIPYDLVAKRSPSRFAQRYSRRFNDPLLEIQDGVVISAIMAMVFDVCPRPSRNNVNAYILYVILNMLHSYIIVRGYWRERNS